ncbi:DUF1206 domain-containing protein [Microvirga splendida]|uniref:DUF1206 domain-containing protein n=1 Tax=Microvirga splendida TaxID=2795727 RepID=A0ABS0Y486_9HYPH|nr:DUF1206 domain-containing protein [Microvirga splendida]
MTIAARAGYGARGALYLAIGTLALLAALDLGGDPVGTRGALRVLFAQPSGSLLLGGIAVGFACLCAWRLIQAAMDPAGYGRDLKGLGIRIVLAASALVYGGIAAFAVGLMLRWQDADLVPRSSAVTAWFASIMAAPFGPWLAGAFGLAVIGTGVAKVIKAWRAEFDEHLECEDHIRLWAVPVSRFGLTARGLLFLLIGGSMVLAAFQLQADRALGLAGVLRLLEHTPYGWILLTAAAFGLGAFGVFGLIEAVYRRIDVKDID